MVNLKSVTEAVFLERSGIIFIEARMLRDPQLLRNMATRCRSIAETRLTEEGQEVLLRMAESYERQARADECPFTNPTISSSS